MKTDVWDERYRTGSYSPRTDPSPLLTRYLDDLPDGRALDVATGAGRNALYLAEHGYEVDAVDVSGEALRIASERADERGLDVNWIRGDLGSFPVPPSAYDVVVVCFYYTLDRLGSVKRSLADDGVLLYEHHLQSRTPVDRGPSGSEFRFESNELLRNCLDLTILHYDESIHEAGGRTAATVSMLARNSTGPVQRYPRWPFELTD